MGLRRRAKTSTVSPSAFWVPAVPTALPRRWVEACDKRSQKHHGACSGVSHKHPGMSWALENYSEKYIAAIFCISTVSPFLT